jgi:Fe-Mn family superoxide dismutase
MAKEKHQNKRKETKKLIRFAKQNKLLNTWIDEQHLGHLTGCAPILALDMWEHAFVADYQPSGKGDYITDFFANLNWSVIEKTFADTQR